MEYFMNFKVYYLEELIKETVHDAIQPGSKDVGHGYMNID